MSSPRLAWAVCIMAALSLGGCVVDATGTDGLDGEDEAGVAVWHLTNGVGALDAEDDGSNEGDVDEETAPDGEFIAADQLQDEYSAQADPHPDPWEVHDGEESAGTGNHD